MPGTIKDYNFLRVAAAAPILEVGAVKGNVENIKKVIKKLDRKKVNLVVFPELCLTAYSCGDMFLQSTLLDSAKQALLDLKNFSKGCNTSFIVGVPISHQTRLYNCAALLSQGEIVGIVPKCYLPNFQEYYEKRWFSSGLGLSSELTIAGKTVPFGDDLLFQSESYDKLLLGIEICEDLWAALPPSSKMSLAGALVIANLSASSAVIGKLNYRQSMIKSQSGRCSAAYISAASNTGESSTDIVFDPHLAIAEQGKMIAEDSKITALEKTIFSDIDLELLTNKRFKTSSWQTTSGLKEYRCLKFKSGKKYAPAKDLQYRLLRADPFIPESPQKIEDTCQTILQITANGLKKRLDYSKASSVIIGLSGGLDSTLALLIAKETLKLMAPGKIKLLPVTMPGPGTSAKTLANAVNLCQALKLPLEKLSINQAVKQNLADLGWKKQGIPFENAQARQRTQILMNLANMKQGIVIGTSDLSEIALGWSTYSGDQTSMYHLCGGIPKTLVKTMITYMAENHGDKDLKNVLVKIVNTPISPELLPAKKGKEISQHTEEIIGSYRLHDFFLFQMLNYGFGPKKIFYLARLVFDEKPAVILATLKIFYSRFFKNQFKRSSMPDSIKVGTIALSPRGDLRMPSDHSADLWLEELASLKA